MELKIQKAHAELKNVNLRTENNGDERVLACDLKIKADCEAREIAGLFEDAPQFLDALYDETGQVLCHEVALQYRIAIENVAVSIDNLAEWKGGKIKKNAMLIPRNGQRMEVTLTMQFSDVKDVNKIAKRLHDEISITITEQQETLEFDDDEDAANEADAA